MRIHNQPQEVKLSVLDRAFVVCSYLNQTTIKEENYGTFFLFYYQKDATNQTVRDASHSMANYVLKVWAKVCHHILEIVLVVMVLLLLGPSKDLDIMLFQMFQSSREIINRTSFQALTSDDDIECGFKSC